MITRLLYHIIHALLGVLSAHVKANARREALRVNKALVRSVREEVKRRGHDVSDWH